MENQLNIDICQRAISYEIDIAINFYLNCNQSKASYKVILTSIMIYIIT